MRGLPQRKLGCGFQGTKGWMLSRKQFPTLTTESFCCARPIGAYMEKHCQEIITLFFFQRSLECSTTHAYKHVVGPFFDDAETQWILPGLGVSSEC